MSVQNYGRTQNQALLAEIEAVEGTLETLDPVTDAIPTEPFQVPLNPQVIESNEATGSLIRGRKTVTRLEPRLTATLKMRGSGNVATAPRIGRILRATGHAETIPAVLPSTGTTDASGGTTTTFTVDRAVGNGTQWPSTAATCAALIGRPVELSTNPAVTRRTGIVNCTISGNIITVTIGETLPSAMSATTDVKVLPGPRYEPTSAIPSVSLGAYRDGKLVHLSGCRGKPSLALPGAERATLSADLAGTFVDETDAAVPATIDFTGLPPEPIWRAGRAHLKKLDIGCSNFTLDTASNDTRYPNPNLQFGLDRNIITSQDPGGVLTTNDKLVATHDVVADLVANTVMPFMAILDIDGPAGTRLAIIVPNFLLLDRGDGDREGILENQLRFQAVSIPPMPAYTYCFF